ncbi:hypothetical protein CK203_077263 [Vitis vinifera]|uniref:AB hydrolase-1 domain-containing protein n=1 Tax=Vitis vinifera TaxID=29760 RepID=A0A438BUA7_VITVI|nr:hypothetical protein CK203_077263 [Vitis vinifera]
MPFCRVGHYQNAGDAGGNNGIGIYYRTYGHGPIKGLTGTETPNDDDDSGADGGVPVRMEMVDAMELLKSVHLIIVEWSPEPRQVFELGTVEWRTKIMAKDAIALMDHLGWRKAHIFGHSMGAMIACKLAAIVPDRVLSLALLNVTGGGFECFPKEYLEEFIGPNTRRDILYQEYVKGISSTGMQSNHGFEGQINACWTHKMTKAELELIRTAGFLISVIHGRYDIIAQICHARRLAEKLQPCAKMIELHGGHLVSHERTEEVNQALLELINASETKISPHDWTNLTKETSGCLVTWMSRRRTDADGGSSPCFLFSILEKLHLCILYLFGLFMLAQEHGRRALRRIKPVRVGASVK